MGVPSGLGAQLGISTESEYGTYVAPTTFLEFTSEGFEAKPEWVRTAGLRAGRMMQSDGLLTQTTRQASGPLVLDPQDKGLGKILNLLHGNTVTPTSLGNGIYSQSHVIGLNGPLGKSATIQVGRPDVTGTVQPYSAVGSKITQAVFKLEQGGTVNLSLDVDICDLVTNESLETATYAADGKSFAFLGAEIEIDDVLLLDCVQSATVTIPIPQKVDRFCIGGGATKKEPLPNALVAPTIALDMEFSSLAQQTAFAAATRRKFELLCGGATTSGSFTTALNFTAATTVATALSAPVSGPDVITQSVTLEVTDDNVAAAPLEIEYITTDTAL